MSASKVRADYPSLSQIAIEFGNAASTVRQMLSQLKQQKDNLQGKDWVGKGADMFYKEMDSAVLPALNRLIYAFELAQRTTTKISDVMKRAEDESAALFKAAASGVAVGGAAAASAGVVMAAFGSTPGAEGGSRGNGTAGPVILAGPRGAGEQRARAASTPANDTAPAGPVPVWGEVTIPAALRAAKKNGIPAKNALLLMIWAYGEQKPFNDDGSPYNPNEHGGRLLNAQPTMAEVARLCPNYAQEKCWVAPPGGDFQGAYIYKLNQLLTPDEPGKPGKRGPSPHFGFGDTYSMFDFTLRRINGERLAADIPLPPYQWINDKLRDPATAPRDFFTSNLDVWAYHGYGASFQRPMPGGKPLYEYAADEVRRWVPKVTEKNAKIIQDEQASIRALDDKILALERQNQEIENQGADGDIAADLYNANRRLIQEYKGGIAYSRQIINEKQQETQMLEQFMTEIAAPRQP